MTLANKTTPTDSERAKALEHCALCEDPSFTYRDCALAARDKERERCAKIATKKAEILRRAAHVVQQPTEDALRMAELAIITADDIATTIRGGSHDN